MNYEHITPFTDQYPLSETYIDALHTAAYVAINQIWTPHLLFALLQNGQIKQTVQQEFDLHVITNRLIDFFELETEVPFGPNSITSGAKAAIEASANLAKRQGRQRAELVDLWQVLSTGKAQATWSVLMGCNPPK